MTQAISNVSLTGGVFQLDLAMASNSTQAYIPLVDLNVVGVNSASGTVKVINADNGKDGKSVANAALFSYSQKLGADQVFAPAEISGTRTFRFQDTTAEMFTFDVIVTAHLANGSGGAGPGTQGAPPPPAGSGSGSGLAGQLPLTTINARLRFTANPLTRQVTGTLIRLN